MTEEEAQKINELYRQIDTLTVENSALKSGAEQHAHQVMLLEKLSLDLKRVENTLTSVSDKR